MKEQPKTLKIFNFSHPLMMTEALSILGSKYAEVLPFKWEMTSDYKEAEVVVWDGIMTPKNQTIVSSMLEDFKTTKILLLMGETMTLFRDHPMVKLVDIKDLKMVEVTGWSALPEEILAALEVCHQKLQHV